MNAVERDDAPTAVREASPPLQCGITVVICTRGRPDSLVRILDSLVVQDRQPDLVMVVDASADARTDDAVRDWRSRHRGAADLCYWRVGISVRGLTRQRNFALDRVTTDLVAFFDDDVVLAPECLREMERLHRGDPAVVGVGCFAGPEVTPPRVLWRLRHRLRIVASLQPGTYHRSGMSIPWEFDRRLEAGVEGDWLPGWGMMWNTPAARATRFHDGFSGYSQGEDLDFSLRLRKHGKLMMARAAALRHLPDPVGRPDPFRQGYMDIYNRYEIHRRGLPDRTARDIAWFVYAWSVDTLLLLRHLVRPSRATLVLRQVAGRLRAAHDLLRRTEPHQQEPAAR